jgi:hypothetical protein
MKDFGGKVEWSLNPTPGNDVNNRSLFSSIVQFSVLDAYPLFSSARMRKYLVTQPLFPHYSIGQKYALNIHLLHLPVTIKAGAIYSYSRFVRNFYSNSIDVVSNTA